MSQEIEHFETRIAKVEEFIRHNKFHELVGLVYQLQESLRVVRDLSFFEKQKQRIERFDKTIMAYVLAKEKELVFENSSFNVLRQSAEELRGLLCLEQYFQRES